MCRTILLVTVLLVAAVSAEVELAEDPPLADPPAEGSVRGTVEASSEVAELTLVSRVTGQRYRPRAWDRETGEFAFGPLPGDAAYDICIRTTDGRQMEGIDLRFSEDRLIRLAARRRKQLGLPAVEPHAFSRADAREIARLVREAPDFLEHARPLYIQGHGRRATVLVEQMRTRGHWQSKGRYVWRVELWYFRRYHGGWQKLANQERLLRRERIRPAAWRKISVQWRPELSVYVDPQGRSEPVQVRIPAECDPRRGRPAGSKPALETKPILRGLDSHAASQPAEEEKE